MVQARGSPRDNAFDESIREYMMRRFRMRLDREMKISPTPQFSNHYTYVGSELISYAFRKAHVNEEAVVDYLNGFRTQKGEMKNTVDLLRFIVKKAQEAGYTVREDQILLGLRWAEVVSQEAYNHDMQYDSIQTNASLPVERMNQWVQFVCNMKDLEDYGKKMIDSAFE